MTLSVCARIAAELGRTGVSLLSTWTAERADSSCLGESNRGPLPTTHDLVVHMAFKGLVANEIGCARISVMAGSKTPPSKGQRAQGARVGDDDDGAVPQHWCRRDRRRDEFLNETLFKSRTQARLALEERHHYKTMRPHSRIGRPTPAAYAVNLSPQRDQDTPLRDGSALWYVTATEQDPNRHTLLATGRKLAATSPCPHSF